MLRELTPIHPRHHHVSQQQIDMITLLRGGQAGFDPVLGFDHLIAGLDQLVTDQVAHTAVVLDKENRLRSLAGPTLRFRGVGGGRLRIRARKIQVEGGAMADLAPDVDPAPAGRDDAEGHRRHGDVIRAGHGLQVGLEFARGLVALRAIGRELLPNLFLSATISSRAGGAPPSSGDVPFGQGWLPDVINWHAGIVLQWNLFDATVLARRDASRARTIQ